MHDEFTQQVLAYVLRPDYRPVKPRVIAKKMGLDELGTRQLKRTIKQLVKRGELAFGSSHLVLPPAGKTTPAASGQPAPAAARRGSDTITGVYRRTQGGFGFVRPSGVSPAVGRDQDIYIAAEDSADAATGDQVAIRLTRRRGKFGAPCGEVVEIVERDTHQFVGTYFESAGNAFVRVDGTLFARPIWVGDPGAKNANPNDKVVFEMVRFPTHTQDGEGVLTEVLGPSGQPGVDTLTIIREYDLPEKFPDDVLDEARRQVAQFDEDELGGRRDLRSEVIVTIDPVDARDFDDAISLERLENGHWRLGVHIADVAHFVQPGTPLDREARQRSTSVYLPDRVIPMLPELISNGLASLQPDRTRYAKTALIEFTPDGAPVDVELATSAIRSRRRFTYEEIDEYLADRDAWQSRLAPEVFALVGRMHELAMILRQRRLARGALELSLEEVKVDLDRHGRVVGAHKEISTESHQIIEEFMLAANEAVARRIAEADWPFLRRVHSAPDPRKLKALTEFVRSLGLQVSSLENRFELQRLLGEVVGRPEQHAVHFAVLRSLQRAVYSPEVDGHYALAADFYCHFTSPIRRYPDLTIHRLVEALLFGQTPEMHFGELVVLGQHCSDRERRAEEAERELTKIKLLNYLTERIGDTLHAVVTGVESFGLFVQGVEIPAEGLVHISSLADDFYHYDQRSHTLTGRREGNAYRLGDRVRVMVARVDVDRRELDFRLVGRDEAAPPAERRPPRDQRPPKRDKHRKKPRNKK